jgi:hypothetical protein
MGFDLSQYETVDERLHKFYETNPNARVFTELVSFTNEQYIVKAFIFRDANDTQPLATGYAEERIGSSPVNRNSALENCETSALGRALANAAVSAKGKRPSALEMAKSERQEGSTYKHVGGAPFPTEASEKQVAFVKTICEDAFINSGWNNDPNALMHVTEWLGNKREIKSFNEFSKKEASRIINDKMGTQGVTNLVKFLQSKQPADRDPWETPKD